MTDVNLVPELNQVLGAMLFGARQPVSVAEMRRVLLEVAETHAEAGAAFAKVGEVDIVAVLEQLKADLAERHIGLRLVEVAGGFRFQTDAGCGPWLRHLLDIGKPTRLTRPTLETLAIIAYRQPVTRAEIESVRGVAVDTIVRNLMELQLIRIVGRSPLPGRPLLLGTTQFFLEHFGLKDVKELPGIEQLCRKEEGLTRRPRPATAKAGEGAGDQESNATAADQAPTGDNETLAGAKAEQGMDVKAGQGVPEDGADDDDDDDEYDEEEDDDDEEDEEENAEKKNGGASGCPTPASNTQNSEV